MVCPAICIVNKGMPTQIPSWMILSQNPPSPHMQKHNGAAGVLKSPEGSVPLAGGMGGVPPSPKLSGVGG